MDGAVNEEGVVSLVTWVQGACQGAWSNVGNLPSFPPRWHSIEELQESIGEVGIRNVIYAQHFRGPDQQLFTPGMKDAMLQSSLSGMDLWT